MVLDFVSKLSVTAFSGAASDKVTALEAAGVVVTDSPAKIGSEMLKVSKYPSFIFFLVTS